MSFINCEINLTLTWPSTCVITNSTGAGKCRATDTKLYVPVVTLLTQDNARLLDQSAFERTINWYKYQSKASVERQNQYLDYLINPSFQG